MAILMPIEWIISNTWGFTDIWKSKENYFIFEVKRREAYFQRCYLVGHFRPSPSQLSTDREVLMQSEGLGLPEKVEEKWHIDLLDLSFFQIFLFLPFNFHCLHLVCVANISGQGEYQDMLFSQLGSQGSCLVYGKGWRINRGERAKKIQLSWSVRI